MLLLSAAIPGCGLCDTHISSHFLSPPLVRLGLEALSYALRAAAITSS